MGFFGWLLGVLRKSEASEGTDISLAPDAWERAREIERDEWERTRTEVTLEGERVASKAERRIADALHHAGVPYLYEPRIAGFLPDFYIPGLRIIIEYWGMDPPGSPHRIRKVEAYKQEGYTVLDLENEDWWDLEAVLLRKFSRWDPDAFSKYRQSRILGYLPEPNEGSESSA